MGEFSLEPLRHELLTLVQKHSIPALGCAIVSGHRPSEFFTFGVSDLQSKKPFTPETPFRVASISKIVTALLTMQLRDSGALRLDEPVAKYLPWFSPPGIDERWPITVRHLLTHTSGLPRDMYLPYWSDGKFPDDAAFRKQANEISPVARPGALFKYSNYGMSLLGFILSEVSGTSFEDLANELLFEPLGISKDGMECGDASAAVGYSQPNDTHERSPISRFDFRSITPAAGNIFTLRQIARLIEFYFSKEPWAEKILSFQTREEMLGAHWVDDAWSEGRAVGWRIFKAGETTVFGQSGWVHGYRSSVIIEPKRGLGVALFLTAQEVSPILPSIGIMKSLIASSTAASLKIQELPPEIPGVYENHYFKLLVEKDGSIFDLFAEIGDERIGYLEPVNKYEYRWKGPCGHYPTEEPVKFEVDESGKVLRGIFGSMYCDRL